MEGDLVAQLVAALRDGLRAANGKPYRDDATFFREGVFVVSPHHAQIRTIQRELAKQRRWDMVPFVDTVDKMQGQEAKAVVVSYGVADPEFALRETEFIYGLNRLNVALTRARTKSIIYLPRPLLDATSQVLDVEAAAVGLAFMRRRESPRVAPREGSAGDSTHGTPPVGFGSPPHSSLSVLGRRRGWGRKRSVRYNRRV
ncbi:MAG: hypothetical protein IT429_15595 [Gemmataceae bacterium]|nr:hypothetical protein [Gemmataceae bacterium]